jgi:hypothetical protein
MFHILQMYSHMNSAGSTVATKMGHVPPSFASILHGFYDLSNIASGYT